MVKINGENLDVAGQTVATYLTSKGYDLKRVAVEKNGEIVPKATYEDVVLQDGETVEVVSFVGGGWSYRAAFLVEKYNVLRWKSSFALGYW